MTELATLQKTALSRRGIIIVDACSLFLLAAQLPAEYGTGSRDGSSGNRLWNILPFLARNGHEIIIPEMVAYEVSGTLRDGFSAHTYFDTSSRKPLDFVLGDFLSAAFSAGDIKIAPPPARDTTPAANYIRTIYRIHNGGYTNIEKRTRIKSVDYATNRKDYGDVAAHQLIANMAGKTSVPVFYLSEDTKALNAALAVDGSINALTMRGLLDALLKENLFSALGMKVSKIDHIVRDASAYMRSIGLSGYFTNSALQVSPDQASFTASLKGIRADFLANAVQTTEAEPLPSGPSRIDRFKNKYPNFLKAST